MDQDNHSGPRQPQWTKTTTVDQDNHSGPRPPHCRGFTITLKQTTLARIPLRNWSARLIELYLTTHNTPNRQTSIPPEGFEPTISASGRRPTPNSARPLRPVSMMFGHQNHGGVILRERMCIRNLIEISYFSSLLGIGRRKQAQRHEDGQHIHDEDSLSCFRTLNLTLRALFCRFKLNVWYRMKLQSHQMTGMGFWYSIQNTKSAKIHGHQTPRGKAILVTKEYLASWNASREYS